jgi:hypothetical protein
LGRKRGRAFSCCASDPVSCRRLIRAWSGMLGTLELSKMSWWEVDPDPTFSGA